MTSHAWGPGPRGRPTHPFRRNVARWATQSAFAGTVVLLASGVGAAIAFGHAGEASRTAPFHWAKARPSSPTPLSTTTTVPVTPVTQVEPTPAVQAPPTTAHQPVARNVTQPVSVVSHLVVVHASPAPPRPAPRPVSSPPSPTAPPPGAQPRRPVDPAQSTPPSSDFYTYCFSSAYNPSACDAAALRDINAALAREGYGSLPLPSSYSGLSIVAQLVAVANAERAVRGLPQMAEDGNLDSMAYNGARNDTDPTGPSGYNWGSNIAMGYPTALSADYVWMYDDGVNSPNIDCHSATDSGCWGHRHNVLIQGGGKLGAGVYNNNGSLNLTQLLVVNYP